MKRYGAILMIYTYIKNISFVLDPNRLIPPIHSVTTPSDFATNRFELRIWAIFQIIRRYFGNWSIWINCTSMLTRPKMMFFCASFFLLSQTMTANHNTHSFLSFNHFNNIIYSDCNQWITAQILQWRLNSKEYFKKLPEHSEMNQLWNIVIYHQSIHWMDWYYPR